MRICDRYRLDVPPDPWPGRVPRYASLSEACMATGALIEASVDCVARRVDFTSYHCQRAIRFVPFVR